MVWSLSPLFLAVLLIPATFATPVKRGGTVTQSRDVVLDDGWFTGIREGGIDKFLGIPFARPP